MKTVADQLEEILVAAGVKRIYGIVGDSLNGLTDALQRQGRIEWVPVRHEEVAAFAAGAEAHLTGSLAVCAGSCGPGNLHLINGLYDCHRSRVPVLAIAAHIPSSEIGSNYFQETHPQSLFRECSHYCELVSVPSQMPRVLEVAIREALGKRGVSILVIPGDVALQPASVASAPKASSLQPPSPIVTPSQPELEKLALLLSAESRVTILCGSGCAGAHTELIALAERLKAPIVHAMRGKEHVCIHFEDWKGSDAIRILDRYGDKVLCYNDDIQGTAGVVLAGLTTALQIIAKPLMEQRILFLGAGSSAIGIANLIVTALRMQGVSEQAARSRISMFDANGLVEPSRTDLSKAQTVFAHTAPPSTDLVQTIEALKPTVLIGVSTKGGAFTQRVVEAMSRLNERPIIFALSNPTSNAECSASDAYAWSNGKALYAAGVQFPDVLLNGRTLHPGQANNVYIFPAIGLATYVARPRLLTNECFIIAAQATADQVGPSLRAKGMLFPTQVNILETEVTTATRVAEFMFERDLAQVERPHDIRSWIESQLYRPDYRPV